MLRLIKTLVASVTMMTATSAATLTVDLNGGADHTEIQSAIDAAANGDTVLVKRGEYVIAEPINFNRLHDPNNPASPPVKNIAVHSEGGAEVTTIRMAETPADLKRASVVIFESGEGVASVLDGFTITGGKGTEWGSSPWRITRGGGIHCNSSSSPTIASCTIKGNGVHDAGGGIYCEDSSPTLTNCVVSGNWVGLKDGGVGGGVACVGDSFPNFVGCTIAGNYGTQAGGVICLDGCRLTGCTISGNTTGTGGGGIACGQATVLEGCTISGNDSAGIVCVGGSPRIVKCVVSGNWDSGVACVNASPELTDCTVSGNSRSGVWCWDSAPILTNCTISGNSALGDGGGVNCRNSSPTLKNCTISGNTAANGGGVHCDEDSIPNLINCIVWGNTPESLCGTIAFCLTDIDPHFVRPGEWVDCETSDDPGCVAYQWDPQAFTPIAWHRWVPGDYRLQPGSPAIDAGTAEGAPTTDIELHVRPCGKSVDIGAYEFGDCLGILFRRGDANADGAVDISDAIAILGYLFLGAQDLHCEQAGDVNDDGTLDMSDAIYALSFLFLDGEVIEPPVGTCEVDPPGHALSCASYPGCM